MQSKYHKAIDKEFDLVVRNGSIVSPTNIFDADIGIKDGEIVSISKDLNIGNRDIELRANMCCPVASTRIVILNRYLGMA